ncbi:hypothetical protein AAE478_004444 [Parahypoxylon ruwenzoriense]
MAVSRLPYPVVGVTPGSPCTAVCLDEPDGDAQDPVASSTNSSDITCRDSQYDSSPTGIKFKNCLSCLQDSEAVSGNESDVAWFLYNLRYAVDVCLFSFPHAPPNPISSPCDIDYGCAPLAESLMYGSLNPGNGSTYGYCAAGNGGINNSTVDACYQCFQASTDQVYLSNFLIALQAGCEQTPEPGTLLGLSGKLFSEDPMTITEPAVVEDPKKGDSNPTGMTTGAIAGIAIGSALVFLGGMGLFIIHHRREKASRAQAEMSSNYDPRGGSGSITAPNHGAFVSHDSKPSPSLMSDYELKAQKAYTNNAEYYGQLEKELAIRRANYTLDPHTGRRGPESALPTHSAYVPGNVSRNSSRTVTPTPPPAAKYHAPDSYALQQYLNAAEDVVPIHHLAPALRSHPPSRTSNRSPSPADSATTRLLQASHPQPLPRPPPPPPPAVTAPSRHEKVPSLSLPSVPRIRIPKKYAPPTICVQGATPIDTRVSDDPHISKPLTIHERRFQDRGAYGAPPADADIVEQLVPPPPRLREDVEVRTGNSSFYG